MHGPVDHRRHCASHCVGRLADCDTELQRYVDLGPVLTGGFGGAAGQAYDPCYHRTCDTAGNIDREVLEQMTEALSRAVAVLRDMREGAPDPEPERKAGGP